MISAKEEHILDVMTAAAAAAMMPTTITSKMAKALESDESIFCLENAFTLFRFDWKSSHRVIEWIKKREHNKHIDTLKS